MERHFCALLLLLLLLRPGVFGKVSCPRGAYRPAEGQSCRPCSVCDRTLVYKQKCTATSNAVCECAPGYSCGKNCEACKCELGQQRTIAGCQSCPDKTFNDQHTGECRPWRKCPGGKIQEPGTKKKDVVCWTQSEVPTSQPSTSPSVFSTKVSSEGGNQLILTSFAFVTILLFGACMVLAYFFLRSCIRKKFPKPVHGQLAQEVDECIYRYPEEEEGGSCEAPASLKGDLLEKFSSQDV
ncbi:tumor necrosis factor receptor superfamily member 9-like [Notechis scutatus]|uniref:Tumor necrosis factor receptor superfamily member 9-like n=1 Tax=Notechis scutatus TaxID=8663 RepID=A0A6J1W1B0_9SAUR|nr:tumor necrosis factor receptor superfamily member 9-like [Notechis scutatus]